MVCSLGRGKMAALARLLASGSVLQTVKEEVGHQRLAAQHIQRELQEADESNLLDEEDMYIFGLRPMSDPLDLVCCNACKKPIKASQYAAHEERCKSFTSREEIILELDGSAVNKKPPRKERKKWVIGHTNQVTSQRERKKIVSAVSGDIAGSEPYLDQQIQITPHAEAKGNTRANGIHYVNGVRVDPYSMDCSENVTLRPSKPFKRTAAEKPSNSGTKNFCATTAEVLPYVPVPLATKVYYSQRSHHLRRAIHNMYYKESNKEHSNEFSNLDVLQVNAVPTRTSSPSNFYHETVMNQQRGEHFSHLAQTPDQILSASSELYLGKSGGFVPSMNISSQLPVNNTLGSHYMPNSYSFAGKAGNPLGTVQEGSGSLQVV